jgi:preprotein translocase subunit SecE
MAEVTDKKSQADATTDNPKPKRRLRGAPPSTETIRERNVRLSAKQEVAAQKQDTAGRSNAFSAFWSGFTWPLRKLGRAIAKLERFRIFRIIGRILFPRYLRNSWKELRLVTWPDRRTSWRLTYAVIVFSILFGVIIYGVDTVLDKLFKEFIIK